MIFHSNSNFNFEFESKGGLVPMIFGSNFRLKLCWRWGAACSMPHVSVIDDACGISAHHMFLSNCVVQVMRVWSLPAVLSPLAKQHIRRRGRYPEESTIYIGGTRKARDSRPIRYVAAAPSGSPDAHMCP